MQATIAFKNELSTCSNNTLLEMYNVMYVVTLLCVLVQLELRVN